MRSSPTYILKKKKETQIQDSKKIRNSSLQYTENESIKPEYDEVPTEPGP